jgi:hypothetical protein
MPWSDESLVSRRATTLLLTGVAAASLALAATAVQAQQARRTTLRPTVPAYVAQQPAPEQPVRSALSATPASVNDPAALIQDQRSTVSRRAPPNASRSVRGTSVRGVTQRQFRPPQPTVTSLPPPPPPPPPRRRTGPLEDPYAPLGLRLGNVVLRPALTSGIGYDTNPQRSAGPDRKGSPFSRFDGEAEIQSDWNVHELTGKLRGGYSEFFRNRDASRPDGEGKLDLRLDASRDTRILLESRLRLDTQRPGSPDLTAAVTGRPLVYQYGASAGVTHDFNRLQMTLRGSVDRSDYEDGKLSNGGIVSQRDRNQTQYGLRLRAAYEVTPGFKPFVQGEVDTREFDEAVDSSGYRRSSDGVTGRVGSTFEISRQLTGEISAGYQNRKYDDNRLRNLKGFVGDAAIVWSPTPLTTVTLRGTSELGDTTIAGSSGTRAHRASLEIAHALRRNLIVTGLASFNRTEYDGQNLREDSSSLGARIEYKLTRTFSVRASFTHERLNSTAPGSDYTANVAQVGLRMQF